MRWILAMTLAAGLSAPAEADMYNGNETPDYTVESTEGAVEIRSYPPHIAAEVTVSGSRDAAINAGFRVLAGYIFGGNEAKAKVAMTTPVIQAPSEKIAMTTPVTQVESDQGWTVQFMMPSEYTLDTLPKPKDSRIRFITTDPVRMAVLRFSGIPTTAALAKRTEELRAWAAAKGLTLSGAPQFMFYDPPFRMPWNRRNEVAFTLK
ncbi:SOUL family heme-binding protein [Tabrizicola sp. BL-A-41-H6]|uniref:SOUL family heme-binding protein n=1 Tax=Tabrizicola sp. BL-A-41-H6 TaxID=3421107 RepID=UPI003D67F047